MARDALQYSVSQCILDKIIDVHDMAIAPCNKEGPSILAYRSKTGSSSCSAELRIACHGTKASRMCDGL